MASDSVRAHEGLPLMNPLALADLDAAIAALDLPGDARVLEVGSGRGDVLARVPGGERVGLDLEAVPPRPGLDLRVGDAASVTERFDCVVCVGSSHAVGGWPDAIDWLARRAGRLLLGEGYWRGEPSAEFLHSLGAASADELGTLDEVHAAFARHGLEVLCERLTSQESFDRYEETLLANARRLGLEAYGDRIAGRRALDGGTTTFGFGIWALRAS